MNLSTALLTLLLTLSYPVTGLMAAELILSVGAGGHRMFSADGKTWEKHASWGEPKHDQNDLNVAIFYKGAAYAGGGFFSGRMTATRDGEVWSDGVIPKSAPIFGLEILNDTLYAVDLRGKVFKTTDGEKYQLVASAQMPTNTHWIRATATGNGIIVGTGDFGPAIAFDPKTESIVVTQMAGQDEKKPGNHTVAFGNGVFVIAGEEGLLATTRDGVSFENNQTVPERGDMNAVVWTGSKFLASSKSGAFASTDGAKWEPIDAKLPSKMVLINGTLFGWSWPPSKIVASRDGQKWAPVPNEQQFFAKDMAFSQLVGKGEPPKIPPAPPAKKK